MIIINSQKLEATAIFQLGVKGFLETLIMDMTNTERWPQHTKKSQLQKNLLFCSFEKQ